MDCLGRLLLSVFLLSLEGKLFQVNFETPNFCLLLVVYWPRRLELAAHRASASISSSAIVAMI